MDWDKKKVIRKDIQRYGSGSSLGFSPREREYELTQEAQSSSPPVLMKTEFV